MNALARSRGVSAPIRELRYDHGWPVLTIDISVPTAERPDCVIAKHQMSAQMIDELASVHHE